MNCLTNNAPSDIVCRARWVVDVERGSIAWANRQAEALLRISTSDETPYLFDAEFLATLRLLTASYELNESMAFDWPGEECGAGSQRCDCRIISLGDHRRGLAVQLAQHVAPSIEVLDALAYLPKAKSVLPPPNHHLLSPMQSVFVVTCSAKGALIEASSSFVNHFGSVCRIHEVFATKAGLSGFMVRLNKQQPYVFNARLVTVQGVRWHQLEVVFHADGQMVLAAHDIHQQKHHENEIFRLNHFDNLTGLPNRFHFYQRLDAALTRASQRSLLCGILYLDLDNFKVVNDTFDHRVGDELIKQVALRLNRIIPPRAQLYRLGGDEFVILLNTVTSVVELQAIADLLMDNALTPYQVAEMTMMVSASIGIACYPEHGDTVDLLLKNADAAMYRAKSLGHNSSYVFDLDLKDSVRAHLTLGGDLHKAIDEGQFQLFYQPKVRLSDEKVVGAEALIRWCHPEMGMISPDKFIPMAEESGLIFSLGEWVIRTACEQLRAWQVQDMSSVYLSVNLSGRQFMQADLVDRVAKILAETNVDAQYLEFELTESMLMADAQQTIEKLHAFRQLGVSLSIDDFGTGYSSLAYLKKFPIQTLKIDRSFVNDLGVNGGDDAIVKATIAMAQSLNLKVIAEGVESRSQIDMLNRYQCQEVQGFLFAKPMSSSDFADFMAQQKSDTDVVRFSKVQALMG